MGIPCLDLARTNPVIIGRMAQITLQQLREYCVRKAGVEETFPFGEDTLVFKVMGKMFALTDVSWTEPAVNLKCDPDWSLILREH